MRKILALLFLFNGQYSFSQETLRGTITDLTSTTVIPFVNIGIQNKNVGATSSADGTFSITIPRQFQNDTLTFSMVGYQRLKIAINQFNTGVSDIRLRPVATQLENVVVTSRKLSEKKMGIVRYNPLLHFIDASQNTNDIFEIAQLTHLPATLSKITSVNLFINETLNDSATFRINFYKYHDGFPAERLIEKNILQTHAINEGWLKLDLSSENIYLKSDVIVAIEFLPQKGHKPVKYEVKLGGRTKSFVRANSLGLWETPPHHYRMFVTALTESSVRHESEENETAPVKRLFSTSVNDTFSIFVGLPKHYQKNKKYPVVYLLDGNVYFDAIQGFLSVSPPGKEKIVVGIGYKNAFEADSLRDRDNTFPAALKDDSLRLSGGANKFIEFIKNDLVPYVDKNYATDTSQRTFMGHSLSGYFTLYLMHHELTTSRPLFKNFISGSPSLEYANGYLVRQFNDLQPFRNNDIKLFLVQGEFEDFNFFDAYAALAKKKKLNITTETILKSGHMESSIPGFKKGLGITAK